MRNIFVSILIYLIGQIFCELTYAEPICYAVSSETFKTCIDKVQNDIYDKIEISQSFTCASNSGNCNFKFQGIKKIVEVYGTTKNISIKRDPSEILFEINDSPSLIIRNITISDNLIDSQKADRLNAFTQPCPNSYVSPDSPVFTIGGINLSDSLHLDNVNVNTVAADIIEVNNANNLLITNSEFSGAGHFGIWMSNNSQKNYIRIFGNKFHDIGANAIILAKSDLVEISGNEFHNNHKLNPFCDKSNHTGGGQIDIEQGSTNVKIQSNLIENGGNASVCGIEFADGSVDPIKNINIYANTIHGNPSGAIIFNTRVSSTYGVQMVSIDENAFYENKTPNVQVNGHREIDIYNNYYTQDLSQSPRASFQGTQKTCVLNGMPVCNLNIIWTSNGLNNPNIIVDGVGLFSINATGAQVAPWIGSNGSVFEILSNNLYQEPVARIYVKGI